MLILLTDVGSTTSPETQNVMNAGLSVQGEPGENLTRVLQGGLGNMTERTQEVRMDVPKSVVSNRMVSLITSAHQNEVDPYLHG